MDLLSKPNEKKNGENTPKRKVTGKIQVDKFHHRRLESKPVNALPLSGGGERYQEDLAEGRGHGEKTD